MRTAARNRTMLAFVLTLLSAAVMVGAASTAYADDCLEFGFTWRRDYVQVADVEDGDSFRIYFSLKGLGFRR